MLAHLSPLFANPGESLAAIAVAQGLVVIFLLILLTAIFSIIGFLFKSRIASGIALAPAVLLTFNFLVAFLPDPSNSPFTGLIRGVAVLGMVAVVAAGASAARAFRDSTDERPPGSGQSGHATQS